MLLTCFIPYIICCPLILQRKPIAQMVDALSCNHWDLGSIPRSLTLFYIFCFSVISCNFPSKAYHILIIQACHLPHNLNPMAQSQSLWCAAVNACSCYPGKSTRPKINGPKMLDFTSNIGDRTPLGIVFLYIFFVLFLLFVLIPLFSFNSIKINFT